MGISVHVYDTISEYVKRNGAMVEPKREINEASLDLCDIYVRNPDSDDHKIMCVVDIDKFFDRPDTSRSITCYQKNNIHQYLTGDERLVKYDEVRYDPKTDNIMFFKKRMRKPKVFFKVGRFWGNRPKKDSKIDWSLKFFNVKMNRIEFILLTPIS